VSANNVGEVGSSNSLILQTTLASPSHPPSDRFLSAASPQHCHTRHALFYTIVMARLKRLVTSGSLQEMPAPLEGAEEALCGVAKGPD
jgi:hypothetical protein